MFKTNEMKKMRPVLIKNSPMVIATALYVVIFLTHIG